MNFQNRKNTKLFVLPFSDLTSGNESYIGGKYIDLTMPKGNTIAISINRIIHIIKPPALKCLWKMI
jgi:uncharacterized protein (DUF1684 family)